MCCALGISTGCLESARHSLHSNQCWHVFSAAAGHCAAARALARAAQAQIKVIPCAHVQFVSDVGQADAGQDAVELVVQEGLQAILPLRGLFDAQKEIARLNKQRGKLEKDLTGVASRLDNPRFLDSAPDKVVNETKQQAADLRERMALIDDKIAQANKLL